MNLTNFFAGLSKVLSEIQPQKLGIRLHRYLTESDKSGLPAKECFMKVILFMFVALSISLQVFALNQNHGVTHKTEMAVEKGLIEYAKSKIRALGHQPDNMTVEAVVVENYIGGGQVSFDSETGTTSTSYIYFTDHATTTCKFSMARDNVICYDDIQK